MTTHARQQPAIGLLGGHGQLGRALQDAAAQRGQTISAPDRSTVDVCDPQSVERWLAAAAPSIVINAAAYTAVDAAEADQDAAFAVNAEGAGAVAAAAQTRGVRVVYVSTDYVFSGSATPLGEDAPAQPLSAYGASKLAGEARTLEHGGTVLRVSWLFGTHGHNFVKTILLRAAAGEPLSVVDDQCGVPCAACDVAPVLLELAQHSPADGVYHFPGTPAVSWFEFAQAIVTRAAELGIIPNPVPVTSCRSAALKQAAQRPNQVVLNGTRLQALLGIQPHDWWVALDRVLRAFAAQPELIDQT